MKDTRLPAGPWRPLILGVPPRSLTKVGPSWDALQLLFPYWLAPQSGTGITAGRGARSRVRRRAFD